MLKQNIFILFLCNWCLMLFSHVAYSQERKRSEYALIVSTYETWKQKQFKLGNYAGDEKCNPDTAAKEGYKGPEMGIPKEISFFYCDINHDEKIDALITFFVDQCDGGNAFMNRQIQLLVLSKQDSYYVDDKYFQKISSSLKKGWIILRDASYGKMYGVFQDYKQNDGRCCPSISKPFSISYPEQKLNYKVDDIIFYKK